MKIHFSSILIAFAMITSCTDTKQEQQSNQEIAKKDFEQKVTKVKTITVQKSYFAIELLSNGKLQSQNKVQIPIEVDGVIRSIKVKNGDRVKKGRTLATINQKTLKTNLEQANIDLESAKIEMQDVLLGFGHKISEIDKVPSEILNNIQIQSGYHRANAAVKAATQKLAMTTITAPFSGVIANLSAKPHALASSYDKTLCTLIDDRYLEVVFPVLESELSQVQKEQEVTIFPFSQPEKQINGKVSEINPMVDENGMVTIKAIIANTDTTLFDGMNVKIIVKKSLRDQIVLPKTAVLLRQNRQVVFTYKDGEAQWIYVEVGKENSEAIIIEKGIKEGDQVIVSGNLNLAHNTEVILED